MSLLIFPFFSYIRKMNFVKPVYLKRLFLLLKGIICIGFCLSVQAQNSTPEDSLINVLKTETDPYTRILIYENLIGETYLSKPDNAFRYSIELIEYSKTVNSLIGLARGFAWRGFMEEQQGRVELGLDCYRKAVVYLIETDSLYELGAVYNNIATTFSYIGMQDSAMFYYWKSLELNMSFKNMEIVSATLNNIGKIYFKQGKIREPLELFSKALFIANTYNYDRMAASALYNIADVYQDHGHYEEALQYYFNSFTIESSLDDKYGMAYSLRAIGNVLVKLNRNAEAMNYYQRSEALLTEIGNVQGLGLLLIDKGKIEFNRKRYTESVRFYQEGLVKLEEVQDKQSIAAAHTRLGECYVKLEDLTKAYKHLNEAYRLSIELGYPIEIRDAAGLFYQVLERKGDKGRAFEVYKKYTLMKDSVENDEAKKIVLQQQIKFEFEREQLLKEQDERERLKAETIRRARRNSLQYTVIFLAILVSFAIIFSSGYLKISYRFAQVLIFGSLLILFEFLLILTDPFLDRITNGIPIYKLLANSVLAFSIFPLHAWLEKRLIGRLRAK